MLTNHVSPALREAADGMGAKGYYDKTRDFGALFRLIGSRAARYAREAGQ